VPPLHAADIARLSEYAWPGNVRELASVLERAVILGDGKRIALDIALGPIELNARPPARLDTYDAHDMHAATGTLDDAIRSHIAAALERCKGKIDGRGGAAELLAVNPSTLRAKMRKLKLHGLVRAGIAAPFSVDGTGSRRLTAR
jgi:DNA-binding NtrC family response regulator